MVHYKESHQSIVAFVLVVFFFLNYLPSFSSILLVLLSQKNIGTFFVI